MPFEDELTDALSDTAHSFQPNLTSLVNAGVSDGRRRDRRRRVLGVVGFDTRLYGPATTLFGIEQAARDAGYTVRVTTLESVGQNSGEEVMRDLMSESLAGVILAAPHDWAAEALRHLTKGTPVVVVDVDIEQESAPVVGIAQHAGARQAAEHLLSLGHQTVWHVAGPVDWPSAQAREASRRPRRTFRSLPGLRRGFRVVRGLPGS